MAIESGNLHPDVIADCIPISWIEERIAFEEKYGLRDDIHWATLISIILSLGTEKQYAADECSPYIKKRKKSLEERRKEFFGSLEAITAKADAVRNLKAKKR